ncbi:hypothetical protein CRD82_21995 [Escherichia coli]|nr:hypothetical protein CRD82_21995 [Escherichia coli]
MFLWQKWDKRPQKGQKWGNKNVDYCALLKLLILPNILKNIKNDCSSDSCGFYSDLFRLYCSFLLIS